LGLYVFLCWVFFVKLKKCQKKKIFHTFIFSRTFEVTGPFIAMIYKMIVGDILTFFCIYCFQLFGFSLGNLIINHDFKYIIKIKFEI